MAEKKKVYDFKVEKTSRSLVTALKRRKNESTVADLVAATGLPKYQVEESLKRVLNEYAGHMKVSESGEILYYFPNGMRNRVRGFVPEARRLMRRVLSVAGKVLAVLFKVWIMVMLVGYFLLFIALLLLAVFASVAGSMSSRDNRSRSRGGGFGGFYMTTRVFDIFLRLWLYSSLTRPVGTTRARPKGKPLHKSVFAFVFGDGDPNAGWELTEKQAVIRFIQSHKGVITAEELMALTGKPPEEAQLLMNRYLLEFEGEPDVTPGGTLIYRFPELMRTREAAAPASLDVLPEKDLIPFNRNEKKTNTMIGALNLVNILFGTYFTVYSFFVTIPPLPPQVPHRALDAFFLFTASLASELGNPYLILGIGLGIVPFVFSLLFYLIPALRRWKENKLNEGVRKENFRKKLYRLLFRKPEKLSPADIDRTTPGSSPVEFTKYRDQAIREVGAYKGVEVEETGPGAFVYSFPELKREMTDVERYRQSIDLSRYSLGDTIFDSGEDVT